jgi:RNA polymerase sigma-70 factor (ECF subfamily)
MRPRSEDSRAEWSSILERTRAGSPDAFEAVYSELAPVVAGYLRMSGMSDFEAVTNDVFADVYRGVGRFRGDWTAFRSWVFTIAHHRMVDETRRLARRPPPVPIESIAVGPTGDVEQEALEVLSDERLASLLSELSSDQRAVLLLRIVTDLPLEDVATALGKTVGAVKSLQHRALATLRRSLTAEETGDG